ncbi:MAG TPA: hypothetical protein VET27_04695 [Mycobacterium sp.]|nr:hypothetical protein [Mycobacterium sp.]
MATLGIRSDPAARAVDCRWDATEPRPMKIDIGADGLTLDLDVHWVDRSFQGQLSLHYKHDIPAEFVCRALGVRVPKTPRQ